ncbi:MAG: MMPL family transporter [Caulobacteraceae bacterium]
MAICVKHSRLVLAVSLAMALGAGWFAATHFKMTTDTEQLISADLPWRKTGIAFEKAFPQLADTTIAVVDGQDAGAGRAGRLGAGREAGGEEGPDPGAGPPRRRPVLGPRGVAAAVAAGGAGHHRPADQGPAVPRPDRRDPSLRGVMNALQTMALGVNRGDAKLTEIDKPVKAVGAAMGAAAAGKPAVFSWQSLLSDKGGLGATRKFIIIRGKLDYTALEPGSDTSAAIRQIARDAGLTPQNGITVRLTGPVPLSDEEFASLADRAVLMASAMIGAVLLMLWLAVRSTRVTAAIMITTILGLVITAGAGPFDRGPVQPDLGGLHPAVRGTGRGLRHPVRGEVPGRDPGPGRSGRRHRRGRAGRGRLPGPGRRGHRRRLLRLPADLVRGGVRAGGDRGGRHPVAFLLNITLLPALLHLLHPPVGSARGGFEFLQPLDEVMHKKRKLVLPSTAWWPWPASPPCPSCASTPTRWT